MPISNVMPLLCIVLLSALCNSGEAFEFDSAEKIEKSNETTAVDAATDVETLSPLKPSDGKVKLQAKCLLPLAEGNGTDTIPLFYFDSSNSTCHPFNYTGSGGNENEFLTELDCLSECYLPVGEAAPLKEEDVVILGRSSGFHSADQRCQMPKDAGNCSDAIERFFFVPEWQSCFAFKYSGCGGNDNRFTSRQECEQNCLTTDGSACRGPSEPAEPTQGGSSCEDTKCPDGFVCSKGFGFTECCNKSLQDALGEAHSERCANGEKARGIFEDYFIATFGANCDDLICGPNESCQQVNKHFAKCCANGEVPTKKPIAHGSVRRHADPLRLHGVHLAVAGEGQP